MTEIYPSDSELLNLISDAETGVEFIPTGTAPYYLHFRKLLYRLLLATKRANDLRVFDDGGLEVGVKSGKYWIGSQLISFTGSTGNVLADDKANIYLYLDADGDLVTDEYVSFPDMSLLKHVRLAVIETSDGQVITIADARDHHCVSVPSTGGGVSVVEDHTSDDTLLESEAGSVHTNRGATGLIKLTLPESPEAGTVFTFAVQANQAFCVDPGAAAICDDSGSTPGKYKCADLTGESIVLVADNNGNWITIGKRGVWVEES